MADALDQENLNYMLVGKAMQATIDLSRIQKLNNGVLENMPPSPTKSALLLKRDQIRSTYQKKVGDLTFRLMIAANIQNPSEKSISVGPSTTMLSNNLIYWCALGEMQERKLYYELSLVTPLSTPTMGGVFDIFSPITSAPVIQHTDSEEEGRGLQTLRYFYDRATSYPEFQMSFDDFINVVKTQNRFAVNSVGGSTFLALENQTGLTETDIQEAMELLADSGQGKIPENWMSYSSAITQKAINPSFFTSLKYTAAASVGDITRATASAGENLVKGLGGLSNLMKYAPLILIGAGALYLFTQGGGIGQLMKGFKKS